MTESILTGQDFQISLVLRWWLVSGRMMNYNNLSRIDQCTVALLHSLKAQITERLYCCTNRRCITHADLTVSVRIFFCSTLISFLKWSWTLRCCSLWLLSISWAFFVNSSCSWCSRFNLWDWTIRCCWNSFCCCLYMLCVWRKRAVAITLLVYTAEYTYVFVLLQYVCERIRTHTPLGLALFYQLILLWHCCQWMRGYNPGAITALPLL